MTLTGYNRWIIRRWQRDHHLLDPSDPEAFLLKPVRRAPRRSRARRYEDLPPPGGAGLAA
jgi:hypothetical protein